MTGRLRRQLSLFAPEPIRTALDALRAALDPVQHGLIPAHVTFAREDELAALAVSDLAAALAATFASRARSRTNNAALTLTFGAAVSFDGHGILLPCVDGEADFHALRSEILTPAIAPEALRRPAAHLTLAHPRNPRAPGNSLASALRLATPLSLTFHEVQLIEQNGAAPWRVLATYPLHAAEPTDA
ncbi:MAG: 2'-5' RNA ligase family protein [Gemmatimonadaceae bacterium]|nr:2'-5' RNA ligase family protein [Gemmatimonadaceae bacterium]